MGERSSRPSADLKPRTASTKHNAQLRMKPIVVINAAVARMPTDTQTKPGQWPLSPPEGCSMTRKPPLAASQTRNTPHASSARPTTQGRKFGPTPP